MTEQVEPKNLLAKAGYYYGECNTELEQAQVDAKRTGELIREIADLLPLLGEEWEYAAAIGPKNISRADAISSHMMSALELLQPLSKKLVTGLAGHLQDAHASAYIIKANTEAVLEVIAIVPEGELSQLSQQMTDSAARLEYADTLNSDTQQHYRDAIAACEDYRHTL